MALYCFSSTAYQCNSQQPKKTTFRGPVNTYFLQHVPTAAGAKAYQQKDNTSLKVLIL